MTIQFGTDGWRAVISDTFTFGNLRLVAQAIADAVNSPDWLDEGHPDHDPQLMVVGHDTRFLSDRFAREVARVLAANDIKVHLAHADAPTPAISYAVTHLRAAGAVMVTASHNAPRYNGIKIKAAYGGSALPTQCRRVEVCLNDNETRARGPNLMDFDQAVEAGMIARFNPFQPYAEHVRSIIDMERIASFPERLHVVADAMYGSGRSYLKSLLGGTGLEVMEIRGEMNPGFGGVHPEPIMKYLGATASAIANGRGDIGLITDGDGDRIGAMDGRGQFIDPHRIMSLCLRYLVEKKRQSGAVVKTVSTTHMLNRQAEIYALPLYETPVGFNHISDLMRSERVLIGGEESGGISIQGHIPEGDGILIGLLLLEVMAAYGTSLHELVENLLRDFGPVKYTRHDLRLAHPVEKKELVCRLQRRAPDKIGHLSVKDLQTTDGVKYLLENDSWLLIRPSGTEPLLRVYAEGRNEADVEALLDYGREVAQSA
ncbi:MAG TPA: phosphoglucomutase/phosphomannomutase family protein [Anaerolineales bacterium]|nr:phosphoglucomutase/phosphomannomutase family protein [Anaerolineales bacterium]